MDSRSLGLAFLSGLMLCSCTSMDMDSMPQTYHYTGHEEEEYQARLQQIDAATQDQQYRDRQQQSH